MGDVVISPAAIGIMTTIVAALVAVIKILYSMLVERLKRAENQVDTLLPITNAVVTSLDLLKAELAKTNDALRNLQNDMKNGRT